MTKRVGIARGIGELYLRGGGHCGIAIGTMTYDHQLVGTFIELEGYRPEIVSTRLLVDLLETGTIFIVDGEVQTGASY